MRAAATRLARTLFGFSEPVNARTYAIAGFALLALKYAVDATVIAVALHRFWSPLAYLSPSAAMRLELLGVSGPLALTLAVWTLPFLWIGVSMTIRRAVDAGWSPWIGLLFFAPVINYIVQPAA